MDNIIIPLSRDCTNLDLRDFCIMTRFCSHGAFQRDYYNSNNTIFTVDRAQTEIEAARSTYLHYVLHSLPLALSSDNLDVFHRVRTVAAAATEFIGEMLTNYDTANTTPIRRQCIEVYTSWILELLPYMNQDKEIRFPMSRTQDIISLVSAGLSGSEYDHRISQLSGSISAFCHAASNVPNLDDETKSRLLYTTWKVNFYSNPLSSSFETFCNAADVWRESLIRAAHDSSPVPHQAVAFERFARFFFSFKSLHNSEGPVENSPYALAAKHLLDHSCHLFVSVSQHKALSTHVEALFLLVLSTLFKVASDRSESDNVREQYIDVIYTLESSILGCIRTVADWFHGQISSCNSCDLLNAAAFHSVICFFKSAIVITKPANAELSPPIPRNTDASTASERTSTEPQLIQSVLNMSILQLAPKILEAYISKYLSNVTGPHESCDLPSWFVPVETLSSVLWAAVHAVQMPLFSKISDLQIPTVRLLSGMDVAANVGRRHVTGRDKYGTYDHFDAVVRDYDYTETKLDRNNMSLLFCLRIHLRLFSDDQLLSAPNFIIENIINLCRRSVLFDTQNESSAVFVPDAHFDLAFDVVSTAATKYCILSPKVLVSIVQATNDLRKEIIGKIAQNAFDTKSAAPGSRQQLATDLAVLQSSLNRSCRIVKVIFTTFIQSFSSESNLKYSKWYLNYHEAIALHVHFLCEAASAVISSREPHSKSSHMSLQHILADLPHFKKNVPSNREYYKLLFSLICFPDAKLYPFQESGLIAGFDLQDSLLDKAALGDVLVIQLQRLEHVVRVAQTLILSHFDGVDVLHEPKKLLDVMQAFPVIFATQFQQLWCGVFTSYKDFILDKITKTHRVQAHVQAQLQTQQRSDWADFFRLFQVGSVQEWYEKMAQHSHDSSSSSEEEDGEAEYDPNFFDHSPVASSSNGATVARVGEIDDRQRHVLLPVPLLTLGDDARIRPFVLSHFFCGLLMSAAKNNSYNNSIFGAFQPTELLALCAPTSAMGTRQNVRPFVMCRSYGKRFC
jgi:hypothetical protein